MYSILGMSYNKLPSITLSTSLDVLQENDILKMYSKILHCRDLWNKFKVTFWANRLHI